MAWSDPKTWSATLVTVADMNTYIRDQQRSGPNATSFAGLALTTPVAGARALIKTGNETWGVVHDGTTWRQEVPVCLLSNVSGSINSTTYTTLAAALIPSNAAMVGTAGATPYFRVMGFVQSATGGETTTLAISVGTGALGGAEATPGTEFGATTSAGNSQAYLDTGWLGQSVASNDYLEAFIRVKSSAAVGAKVQARVGLWFRWSG